jgi:hypothetical protein
MHTGWGWNRNYAAKRILMAFYLDFSRSELDAVPTANDLFPRLDDDPFARFLLEMRQTLPTRILEPFYTLG